MAHPYIKEIRTVLAAHKNATIAKGAKAYLLHQFEFFGIKTPLRRKLCNSFYKNHPVKNYAELSAIIKECFNEPERELHYFGIELLGYHKKLWSKQTLTLIEWMITHQSWWDSVDSINSHVIGKFFIQFPAYIDTYTFEWNQSNNKWLQRMSILFQLMYKDKTNTTLLTNYIEHCQMEQDFFIRKSIGWSLRAYAYTNPKWVKDFVKKHPLLSPLSKREALKQLNN
jgi:3-methyladenine DNA glycosylase AlkD